MIQRHSFFFKRTIIDLLRKGPQPIMVEKDREMRHHYFRCDAHKDLKTSDKCGNIKMVLHSGE